MVPACGCGSVGLPTGRHVVHTGGDRDQGPARWRRLEHHIPRTQLWGAIRHRARKTRRLGGDVFLSDLRFSPAPHTESVCHDRNHRFLDERRQHERVLGARIGCPIAPPGDCTEMHIQRTSYRFWLPIPQCANRLEVIEQAMQSRATSAVTPATFAERSLAPCPIAEGSLAI